MQLTTKTLYLTHEDDSYEVVVDRVGRVLELWRYRANHTVKPTFVHVSDLNQPLQDRIADLVMSQYGTSDFSTNGS